MQLIFQWLEVSTPVEEKNVLVVQHPVFLRSHSFRIMLNKQYLGSERGAKYIFDMVGVLFRFFIFIFCWEGLRGYFSGLPWFFFLRVAVEGQVLEISEGGGSLKRRRSPACARCGRSCEAPSRSRTAAAAVLFFRRSICPNTFENKLHGPTGGTILFLLYLIPGSCR